MVDWSQETLYLSVFEMNARATANPYQVHRHLWRAFPDRREETRPFLFHIARDSKPAKVVMQSTLPPEPVTERDFRLVDRKAFRLTLQPGVEYAFRITANPTRRESESQRRIALGDDAERIAWLRRRLEPLTELTQVNVQEAWRMTFQKHGRDGVVDAVTFTGRLRVQDPSGLGKAIAAGLGPAKAFGCGLLLLHAVASIDDASPLG